MEILKKVIVSFVIIALFFLSIGCSVNSDNSIEAARNGAVMLLAGDTNSLLLGSGFCVGKQSKKAEYVVTNYHVIQDAYKNGGGVVAILSLETLDMVSLELVVGDSLRDLAILKMAVPTSRRSNLALGTENDIAVADVVYAIGYPGASSAVGDTITGDVEDTTITRGIVSKKLTVGGRKCYQIDASLSSGNSGGPLINGKGQVIGINTFSNTLDSNMYYAVQTDVLIPLLEQYGIPYTRHGSNAWLVIVLTIALAVLAFLLLRYFNVKIPFALVTKRWIALHERRQAQASVNAGGAWSKQPVLCGVSGVFASCEFPLGQGLLTLGRNNEKCSVVYPVDTQGISGVHCSVLFSNHQLYVTDLDSKCGTYMQTGEIMQPQRPYPISSRQMFYLADPQNSFTWKEE